MTAEAKRSAVDVMMIVAQFERGLIWGQSKWQKCVRSHIKDHCSAFIKCVEKTVEPFGRPFQIVQASCSGGFEKPLGRLLRGADYFSSQGALDGSQDLCPGFQELLHSQERNHPSWESVALDNLNSAPLIWPYI